jgi:hypothetical protein
MRILTTGTQAEKVGNPKKMWKLYKSRKKYNEFYVL